jgi:hypothetical protein
LASNGKVKEKETQKGRPVTSVVLKIFTSEPPLTRENTLRPPACFFITK